MELLNGKVKDNSKMLDRLQDELNAIEEKYNDDISIAIERSNKSDSFYINVTNYDAIGNNGFTVSCRDHKNGYATGHVHIDSRKYRTLTDLKKDTVKKVKEAIKNFTWEKE